MSLGIEPAHPAGFAGSTPVDPAGPSPAREASAPAPLRAEWGAYVALTKPRIALMVLLTVAVGYLLGARGRALPSTLAWTLIGTGLVAAGASAWNQVLEGARDSRMRRTRMRPIPTGQVAVLPAAVFATALSLLGLALLAAFTRPAAVAVAASTLILYVAVYTPMKPLSTLNTAVVAIPGALPPVIGWAAATGRLSFEGWTLFLIVFLWQFPHFLAIAWIHREDYARGGHRMLPLVDPQGKLTGRQAAVYALILVPCGLLPSVVGIAGTVYFVGALAASLFYLWFAVRFWADVNDATARGLLKASIVYLPTVISLLLLNPLPA